MCLNLDIQKLIKYHLLLKRMIQEPNFQHYFPALLFFFQKFFTSYFLLNCCFIFNGCWTFRTISIKELQLPQASNKQLDSFASVEKKKKKKSHSVLWFIIKIASGPDFQQTFTSFICMPRATPNLHNLSARIESAQMSSFTRSCISFITLSVTRNSYSYHRVTINYTERHFFPYIPLQLWEIQINYHNKSQQ